MQANESYEKIFQHMESLGRFWKYVIKSSYVCGYIVAIFGTFSLIR